MKERRQQNTLKQVITLGLQQRSVIMAADAPATPIMAAPAPAKMATAAAPAKMATAPAKMAAAATPAKPTKKQQRQQKQVPAKTALCSPFSAPRWSSLPQGDMLFILDALRDKLRTIGLEKTETNPFRQWRKKKPSEMDPVTPPPVTSPSGPPIGPPRSGWTVLEARRQLAIGINEVTRALERNQLSLVLVCKSVKPVHMTNHLITLSRTRAVPACQVPQLSATVSTPLGLRSVLALGFHRGGLFTDTVDAIAPRVPALCVEWITEPGAASREGEEPGEEPADATGEEEESGGRKRKFEESKDDDDAEDDGKMEAENDENKMDEDATKCPLQPTSCPLQPTSCPLQPLKVKKIVPNPLKKRKQKKNKKKSKA